MLENLAIDQLKWSTATSWAAGLEQIVLMQYLAFYSPLTSRQRVAGVAEREEFGRLRRCRGGLRWGPHGVLVIDYCSDLKRGYY